MSLTKSSVSDLSLLEVLQQRLRLFVQLGNYAMSEANSAIYVESSNLSGIKTNLINQRTVLYSEQYFIQEQLDGLYAKRKAAVDYEGASQDRANYTEQINSLLWQKDQVGIQIAEVSGKINRCQGLINRLNSRSSQYNRLGKKNFQFLLSNLLPKGIKVLEQIISILQRYLSTSSPRVSSSITTVHVQDFIKKGQKKFAKKEKEEQKKNEISEGRKRFEDVQITKEKGKKVMKVGFKKIDLAFNSQTLVSLEKEAMQNNCEVIEIKAFGEHVKFFEDNGFQVKGKTLGFWSGTIMTKNLFNDPDIEDPEVVKK